MPLHTHTTVRIAACAMTLTASAAHADVLLSDSFESYTANAALSGTYTAPGTTIPNSWSGTNSVVTADGSAYQGSNYLRISDTDTATTYSARDNFAWKKIAVGTSGIDISVAIRVTASGTNSASNTANIWLYAYNGTTNLLPVGVGIAADSHAFDYYSYNGTAQVFNTLPQIAELNRWYVFNIHYSVDTSNNPIYSFTVTDTTTNTEVANVPNVVLTGFFGTDTNYANLANVLFQTSKAGTGYADFDALTVSTQPVPEPASLMCVGIGASMLMLCRRRQPVG